MGDFFVYILKSSVCLAVFYLFYRLLLSRETFHRFNRIALLSVIVLSVAIPFIRIITDEPVAIQRPLLNLESLLQMAEMQTDVVCRLFGRLCFLLSPFSLFDDPYLADDRERGEDSAFPGMQTGGDE